MDATKLNKIIADKNSRLEDDAVRTAASIIDEIAKEQQNVTRSNERIAECRKELRELEVRQLDPTSILGS